jgi:hypothetical protein
MPSLHPAASHNVRLSPRLVTAHKGEPSPFTSGAFGTAIVDLMGAAMDKAWADFEPLPKNKDLARSLMSSAIIEAIVANVREHDVLVRKATVTLMAAIKLDQEALSRASIPTLPKGPRVQSKVPPRSY